MGSPKGGGSSVKSRPLCDPLDCGLSAGFRDAFLVQVTGLEGAVKAAREQLQALSRGARCAQAGDDKTCIQLADLGVALASSEEEILHAATVLASLVPGEHPPHPEAGFRACGPGDASFPFGEARFLPGQMGGTESLLRWSSEVTCWE